MENTNTPNRTYRSESTSSVSSTISDSILSKSSCIQAQITAFFGAQHPSSTFEHENGSITPPTGFNSSDPGSPGSQRSKSMAHQEIDPTSSPNLPPRSPSEAPSSPPTNEQYISSELETERTSMDGERKHPSKWVIKDFNTGIGHGILQKNGLILGNVVIQQISGWTTYQYVDNYSAEEAGHEDIDIHSGLSIDFDAADYSTEEDRESDFESDGTDACGYQSDVLGDDRKMEQGKHESGLDGFEELRKRGRKLGDDNNGNTNRKRVGMEARVGWTTYAAVDEVLEEE
ncbi:hypothetical protein EX30DRAFT_344708 [Ascodesmis nigricans]|uniref:Uncharacterized protein n=1 Tax=Ascodesmis nigricans TaxID=341454 RepID=A0A4S2MQQ9_9PEZI|nr:hypothetical protein EX30DRAFT_344708 [Ascodesmis nigricans]